MVNFQMNVTSIIPRERGTCQVLLEKFTKSPYNSYYSLLLYHKGGSLSSTSQNLHKLATRARGTKKSAPYGALDGALWSVLPGGIDGFRKA